MAWYNPFSWGGEDPGLQQSGFIQDKIRGALGAIDNRQAPQAGRTEVGNVVRGQAAQINTAPQDQYRGMEMELARRLQGISSGQQKGAGQLAVDDQVRRGIASQQAMARMGRGQNSALAGRAAARNVADMGVAGAGQARQAALQDQAQANAQLAGVIGQGRGADIGLATQQAGMNQQMNMANLSAENQRIFQQAGLDQATSLANMDARLRQMGMDDQARLAYLAQLHGMDVAQLQAQLQAEQGDRDMLGNLLQAGGGVAGAAIMASDKRAKKKIRHGASEIDEMLDAVSPATYEYKKPEQHGTGRWASVMAQDLERSRLGREIVQEAADGTKMLNVNKVVGAALAATARLNQRVRDLEKR